MMSSSHQPMNASLGSARRVNCGLTDWPANELRSSWLDVQPKLSPPKATLPAHGFGNRPS
jgi:hypothetical protein